MTAMMSGPIRPGLRLLHGEIVTAATIGREAEPHSSAWTIDWSCFDMPRLNFLAVS
jgi:hypothetical protein